MSPAFRALPALAGLAAVLAGCSTFSDPAPSTGIDELVVPAPALDPDDFVDDVDNRWFVLDDVSFAGPDGVVEQTVDDGPDVAGVPTTAVTLGDVTDLYAQDDAGNVWWLARVGEWTAGEDGALAGLAMPAEPRVGDGWRRAQVPGADLRATVVEVDDDEVVLELVDDDVVAEAAYVDGTGLEDLETVTGELVLAR